MAGSRTIACRIVITVVLCAAVAATVQAAICPEKVLCQESRHLYPSWSPDGTRIVLASYRGYENAIVSVNADGTDLHRIGPLGDAEHTGPEYALRTYPTLSPDGTRLAYSRSPNGQPSDLFVSPVTITQSFDTPGVLRLTNDPADDFHPRWSPDGQRIAFASNRDGDYEIYTIAADGSDLRQLTHNDASDSHPGSWSPDGTQVAFVSDRDGDPEIYAVAADGSTETRLTTSAGNDSHPAWSPDGMRIAFFSDRDGNHEIYVMNADGSGQTRLTDRSADDHDPSWSPDGERIAFATNVDFEIPGSFDIHTIRPDGTDERRVTFTNEISLGGAKLTLKSSTAGPVDRLKVASVRAITPTPTPFAGPSRGSSLRVIGAGTDVTYDLDSRGWRTIGGPPKQFLTFDYRATGPVARVKVTPKGIKVTAAGALAGSIASDPGPIQVVLTTGRLVYCMAFDTAHRFRPGEVYDSRDTAPPAACPE